MKYRQSIRSGSGKEKTHEKEKYINFRNILNPGFVIKNSYSDLTPCILFGKNYCNSMKNTGILLVMGHRFILVNSWISC